MLNGAMILSGVVGPQFLPVRESFHSFSLHTMLFYCSSIALLLLFYRSSIALLLLFYCYTIIALSSDYPQRNTRALKNRNFSAGLLASTIYLSLVGWRLNNVRVFGYRGAGLDACKCNFNTWRMGLAMAKMKMERQRLAGSHARVASAPWSHPLLTTIIDPGVASGLSVRMYSTVHPQPQISEHGASW